MASFRKIEKQVAYCIREINGLGRSRAHTKENGQVSSVRTLEHYKAVFTVCAEWMQQRGYRDGLHRLTPAQATEFLKERAAKLTQKSLDGEAAALRKLTRVHFPRVHSTHVPTRLLATESRAYTREELDQIAAHQSNHNSIATQVAREAGLRSAELFTLQRWDERPPSVPDKWDECRWVGKENWVRYTVRGKGGLIREVRLTPATARQFEARRCAPHVVIDRRIRHTVVYDLGGGNAWARSFRDASQRVLGYSRGAHGVRHSFAQAEVARFLAAGRDIRDAKRLTSQLMGHWREDIVRVYLR